MCISISLIYVWHSARDMWYCAMDRVYPKPPVPIYLVLCGRSVHTSAKRAGGLWIRGQNVSIFLLEKGWGWLSDPRGGGSAVCFWQGGVFTPKTVLPCLLV